MPQPFGLIIEDDLDIQKIFSEILELCEVDCKIIPSGSRAIEFLANNIPDIMLVDMHLPGANGVEIINVVRENEAFDNTIIMVVSADHMMSSSVDDLVDAVILKPVDVMALKNMIDRLISSRFNT